MIMTKYCEVVIEGEIVEELEYCQTQKKRGRKPKKDLSTRIIIPKTLMKEHPKQYSEMSDYDEEDEFLFQEEVPLLEEPDDEHDLLDSSDLDINNQDSRNRKLTKRQMSFYKVGHEKDSLVEMPFKKPRKKRKDILSEEQLIKKQETEQKRRQQMLQVIEQQKLDTVDRIINETGRKQKKTLELSNQDHPSRLKNRLDPSHPTLKYISNKQGNSLLLSSVNILFPSLPPPVLPINHKCTNCQADVKYKLKHNRYVCGLSCYNVLTNT